MLCLESLPEELLNHILDFLTLQPPSEACAGEVPTIEQLTCSSTPLKNLSLVNKLWRRLSFPILFSHLKVDLKEILPPAHYCIFPHQCTHDEPASIAPDLVHFVDRNELYTLSPNLLVYQDTECTSIAALGNRSKWKMWQRILSTLKPFRLIIIAPPRNMGDIVGRSIDMTDSWAFKIRHQRLELALSTPFINGISTADASSTTGITWQVLERAQPYQCAQPSPFHLLPFDSLTYHGGSCLPVFGEYHYFEKRPPCLLASDRLYPSGGFANLSTSLAHFTYITVFPHLIHMQQLVRGIASLRHLKSLTMQLTPSKSSTMLDDLDLIGRGNLNLRDCWTEVERSYAVLVAMCQRSGTVVSGNLPSLALPAVQGQGVLLPVLERFTSLDYRRGILVGEIDDVFEKFALGWGRDDEVGCSWVRGAGPEHEGLGRTGFDDADEVVAY